MATLFNTKISATYQGLFKTIDNAVLSASLRELTDGAGNQSGLFLNTAGDFKVTSVLEWGSLKDTGTGVTITQFVTAANGIENFNNDTTLPTSAAVKLYVDTKFSQTDTLTEVLGFGNTTSGKDIAVSAGDDITFTDTSKAIFGVGSDLQIYHSGSDSFIENTGGDLKVTSTNIRFLKTGLGEFIANFFADGANEFFFDGTKRIETLGDGAKVTGNLVVTGSITANGGSFLPLLGGTMTGNTLHGDNVKSVYGTGGDLEIFHDGSNSFIKDTGTGDLRMLGSVVRLKSAGDENMVVGVENAGVTLYYDAAPKLSTTSTGIAITGALSTTTNVSVGANATFVDNGKALFGDSNDLEILHNSTTNANVIQSNLSRQLALQQDNLFIANQTASEIMITAISDGAVSLYYDNTKRIETVSDGAKITGNLVVTGNITANGGGSFLRLDGGTMTGGTIHNDNVKSLYGTSGDFEIFYDGTNALLDNYNGSLRFRGNTIRLESHSLIHNFLVATESSGVQLFFNDVQKFVTTSTGISVTGNGAFSGSVSIPNAGQLQLGTGLHMLLQHNSANGFIKNFTGQLNIEQAAVTEAIVFKTSNSSALDTTALTINRVGDLITGNDVTIAGDLTVNGTTTTVNSQTLSVVDPLISLATANTANSLDIGFYGKYNDSTNRYLGLFNDASDSNKFKLFRGTTVEPTTTVNVAGAGYVAADLVVAGLEGSSVVSTGSVIAASGNSGQITLSANSIGSTNNLILSTGSGGSNIEMYNTEMYFDANTHFFRSANAASTYLSINSTSASFAGDLSSVGTLTLKSDSTYFRIKRANNTDVGYITDSGTWGDSGADFAIGASSSNLKFYTNNSTAVKLTLDASGNATFAGNILMGNTVTNPASGFSDQTGIGLKNSTTVPEIQVSSDSTAMQLGRTSTGGEGQILVLRKAGNVVHNFDTNNVSIGTNATFAGNVAINNGKFLKLQRSSGNLSTDAIGILTGTDDVRFLTTGEFDFVNGSLTNILNISNTGNATFAGSVTVSNLKFDQSGVRSWNVGASGGNLNITSGDSNGTVAIDTGLSVQDNATFSGNVGIGIAPQASRKLSIQNVDADNELEFYGTDFTNIYSQTNSGMTVEVLGTGYAQLATVGGNLRIANSGASTFSGDVTTGGRLRVASGTDQGSQLCLFADGNGATSLAGFTFSINTGGNNSRTQAVLIDQSKNATFAGDVTLTGTGDKILDIYRDGGSGHSIRLHSEGVSWINNNNNFGIGTTEPNVKLRIAGTQGNPATSGSTSTGFLSLYSASSSHGLMMGVQNASPFGSWIQAQDKTNHATNYNLLLNPNGGNVGIGTDSPDSLLEVVGADPILTIRDTETGAASTNATLRLAESGGGSTLGDYYDINYTGGGNLRFLYKVGAAINERMRITSSGIVKVGGTDTGYSGTLLHTGNYSAAQSGINILSSNTGYGYLLFGDGDGAASYTGQIAYKHGDEFMAFNTNSAERMRITSVGNVLIGVPSISDATSRSYGNAFAGSSANGNWTSWGSGGHTHAIFRNGTNIVGTITTSGSATAFNTSSDYRLKEDLQDFNGLEMVSNISVYDYKWKVDESRSYGVMAHELQEVLPQAVVGEKDAEEYQAVDYSKIVPVLVKAIQELKAEIELLKAK